MNADQATSIIARNRFPLLPHCGNKREREAETAPSTILKRRGYAFDFTVGFKLKVLKKEQNCTLPALLTDASISARFRFFSSFMITIIKYILYHVITFFKALNHHIIKNRFFQQRHKDSDAGQLKESQIDKTTISVLNPWQQRDQKNCDTRKRHFKREDCILTAG